MRADLLPVAEHRADAQQQRLRERAALASSAFIHHSCLFKTDVCLQGVDTGLFRPEARSMDLRRSWTAERPLASTPPRRSSLDTSTPPRSPPPYYPSESKIVLLYVGRISWEKNLRLLVEAARGLEVASADGSRPACQLVFVGDGPSRPELEVLCASYGLDAVFMGYRKGEELAADRKSVV